ncbi:hypothetical protein MMPV_006414 [Pyropia vietnamensis]
MPSPRTWQWGQAVARCTSGDVRLRKEVRTLTQTERRRFVDAVVALVDSGIFAQFVPVHARWGAHGRASFFPWHRLFLLEFEDALRTVDPQVTLPFWDWSQDAARPADSMVWGDDLLGGATPGDCIPSGPFAGMERIYPTRRCVWRGFTASAAGRNTMGGQTFEDAATIQAAIAAPTSYDGFRVAIEVAHGSPHSAIGGAELTRRSGDPDETGEMGLASLSPSDPAFYVHHAYIDSVWTRRQGAPGRRATEYGGQRASHRDRLTPFGGAIVADTFNLPCVRYQVPLPAAAAGDHPSAAPRDGRSPSPTPSPAASERAEARAAVAAERAPRAAVQAEFARAVGQSEAEVVVGEELLEEAATEALLDGTLAVRVLAGGEGRRGDSAGGGGLRLIPRYNGTAVFL